MLYQHPLAYLLGLQGTARADAGDGSGQGARCGLPPRQPARTAYRIVKALPEGGDGYLPHYDRPTSEYLATALPLGFLVRHCEELRFPLWDPDAVRPAQQILPEHPSDIWTLRAWYPAASSAAHSNKPLLIFWDFER